MLHLYFTCIQVVFIIQWSYGVVVWEIFSYGELPYMGIENMDVLTYLMNGHRLKKPIVCPDEM